MSLRNSASIFRSLLRAIAVLQIAGASLLGQVAPAAASELPGDRMLAAYFESEVGRLEDLRQLGGRHLLGEPAAHVRAGTFGRGGSRAGA